MSENQKSRFLILSTLVVALCLAVPLLLGQNKNKRVEKSPAPTQREKNSPLPTSSTSPQATDLEIAREIDRALAESDLRQARWGIFVMSMKDERVVYAHNADELFTPASNMKVYTTAVALDTLGADHRWRTSVYSDGPADGNGMINGDLTLYGRGAPDLVSKSKGSAPSLAQFADQLYRAGVRHVRGDIIGDESYFRGELFGLGWQWNDLQWYYGAEPSALSIDENNVELTIAPGEKTGSAASLVVTGDKTYLHLTNNTNTAARDETTTIGIQRGLSNNELRVWGDFPVAGRAYSAFLSVHNPALWAATLFREALVARGIQVDGQARSRDFRAAENDKFDPQKAVEIAYLESEPLGDVVRKTNKESNNLFAELLLRTIGKERGSSAPDPDSRKNRSRGDDEAGSAVVKSWLERNGIGTSELAFRDGSGLSRLDLVTPATTVKLLQAISRTNSAGVFHDSLPIAGQDGTLGSRLGRVSGKIFAKTGTLTYTHSLSGYATGPNDEVFAFSVLCNDAAGNGNAVTVIDRIAATVVTGGRHASGK
jgi:serine-type D-Ala-D-Ala carboxypeptidase/endopeptidase (penicillin-binding protein 4)